MDLYSKILNINNKNIEYAIISAIEEVKKELAGLDYERMCLVYNSYLYEALLKRHVLVHMVDTKDLGLSYNHRFLIAFDGTNYYLCDLTYSQFLNDDFPSLQKNGYQKCDDDLIKEYLKTIDDQEINIGMNEVFTSNNNYRK